jgi:hypothetical protein
MRTLACLSLLVLAVPLAAQADKNFNHPYFPLKVGNKWLYRAGMPQHQLVTLEVERREVIKVEIKDETTKKMNRTGLATYVLRLTSGDKEQREQVGILSRGVYRFTPNGKEVTLEGGVYRFQTAGKDLDPPLCFLKLPLKPGESWEVNSVSEGVTIKGAFVGGEASVKVPSGEYQALTVMSKDLQLLRKDAQPGSTPLTIQYWFANQVGPVKMHVETGNFKSTLELEKFEPAP